MKVPGVTCSQILLTKRPRICSPFLSMKRPQIWATPQLALPTAAAYSSYLPKSWKGSMVVKLLIQSVVAKFIFADACCWPTYRCTDALSMASDGCEWYIFYNMDEACLASWRVAGSELEFTMHPSPGWQIAFICQMVNNWTLHVVLSSRFTRL